jgi:thioredoxin 1
MANEHVKEFTDANFQQEVIAAAEPVLVDFWAEWCMPCRLLAPIIDKVALDYSGKVKVGKVDTDSNRDIALKYSIQSIPTVMLFRDGNVLQKMVGVKSDRDFRSWLDASLK